MLSGIVIGQGSLLPNSLSFFIILVISHYSIQQHGDAIQHKATLQRQIIFISQNVSEGPDYFLLAMYTVLSNIETLKQSSLA